MPKRTDSIVRREIRGLISERLYNELQLVLLDPHTSRPRYGAVSRIMEIKLREFIREVQKNGMPAYLME